MKNENPFSFRRVTTIPYWFPSESSEGELLLLVERFEQCRRVAQIVGPHGTGKSTLLDALIGQLHRPVFKTVLRDRQRRLPPDFSARLKEYRNKNSVVVIDGYEQLAVFSRLWLEWERRRFGFGLLITAHRPVLGLPILWETAPSRETYNHILRALLRDFLNGETEMHGTLRLLIIIRRIIL